MIFRLIATFALTLSPALCEDTLDRSRLLSSDENVRGMAFEELESKSTALSDADCIYLVERSADSTTAPNESLFLLMSVFASLNDPARNIPAGKKPQTLSPQSGNSLIGIAENGTFSDELRTAAIRCLFFSFDKSEEGVSLENRLFLLLSKNNPKKVRTAVVGSFQCFSLERGSNLWNRVVAVLGDEKEDEFIRLRLVESLVTTAHHRLISNEDVEHLFNIAFMVKNNSEVMRTKLLATEADYRGAYDIIDIPSWAVKAVAEDFTRSSSSATYKTELADYLSECEIRDVSVVSEAIRLSLDNSTDMKLRKACLNVIRKCEITDEAFSGALEDGPKETVK